MNTMEVYRGLIAFISEILPSLEARQGYQNDVPVPKGDFCIVTILDSARTSTTNETVLTATDIRYSAGYFVNLQVDFFSQDSVEMGSMFSLMFRSVRACNILKGFGISPIEADYPASISNVMGDRKYTLRSMVNAKIYLRNEVVSVASTAKELEITNIYRP